MRRWHIFIIVIFLIIVLIGGVAVLFWHKKNKDGDKTHEPSTKTEKTEVGEFLAFSYSPGYSDMDGARHREDLEKDASGKWIITKEDRSSFEDPTIVTKYEVPDEEVAKFAAFIVRKNVLDLQYREDSDDFITDYASWGYRFTYDNSSVGGDSYETYGISEYKQYSDKDYELLKELDTMFENMHTNKISEEELTEEE